VVRIVSAVVHSCLTESRPIPCPRMRTESRSNGKFALGSAFEGRGRSSFLLWICHSVIVSAWLATLIAIQPWFRFRSPKKWMAETEIVVVVLNLLFGFAFIRHFDLHLHAHLSLPISREQISAISIVSGVLLSSFEVEHTSSADVSAKPRPFRNFHCAARKQIAIPERRI